MDVITQVRMQIGVTAMDGGPLEGKVEWADDVCFALVCCRASLQIASTCYKVLMVKMRSKIFQTCISLHAKETIM